MSKHTTGPWTAGNVGVIWTPDENRRLIVARVGAFQDKELLHFSRERWTADARLIAAAPELLAALEDVLAEIGAEWDDSWSANVYDAAVIAVAKARGEAQP